MSGEAIYTDDIVAPNKTLYGALVMSTQAHAKVLSIDDSAARLCTGFVRFICAKDMVGSNKLGAIVKDEEVFCTSEVHHVGQVIGIVVAETHEQAWHASHKVIVQYEPLPAITNIDDAIAENSFFADVHRLQCGSLSEAESKSAHIVEGEVRVGGQEHFYLETNCALAVPLENGMLEVTSSTQNPSKTQVFCASACGIPSSHVIGRCKRMGGGFGGKETRSVFIACTVSVAAHLMNRPVRINIERDVDMSISGQRNPFLCKYRAGCSEDGKLQFLEGQLYLNAGFSLDLSLPVMDRAIFHSDNAYLWPVMHLVGKLCRTNLPTNTAFRGFGGPQGMMLAETALEHLASKCGLSVQEMRARNLYVEGDHTHFKQRLTAFHVPRLWSQVLLDGEVASRQAAVDRFNAENKWKKRGLCVLPTKFGIAFTAKFMNQGGALVHVYFDGSVLISHGGTEMGQGLHTKVIQIAAHAFNIPHSRIHINETATNFVPNGQPTAASMSTDLYGMAVLDACNQILARLKPLSESTKAGTWEDLVYQAYYQRINLSAQGFFIVPNDRCGYNWALSVDENAAIGTPFN